MHMDVVSLQNVVTDLQDTIKDQQRELLALKQEAANVVGVKDATSIESTQIRTVKLDNSVQENSNAADPELKDGGQSEQDISTQANAAGLFSIADNVEPERDLSTQADFTELVDKPELQSDSKLAIFYNIYLPPDEDDSRRKKIMDDIFTSQINFLGNSYAVQSEGTNNNTVKFFYNTIGFPLEHSFMVNTCAPFKNLQPVHMKHYEKGFEEATLNALQEYCMEYPTNNVIYIHPKGSFHDKKQQQYWRKEGTMKASSEECTKYMEEKKCNACGARFTYIPQHFSGNFWRAQCSYIRELRDPREIEPLFREAYKTAVAPPMNMTFIILPAYESMLGIGRFAAEQWIGSHPNFSPCTDQRVRSKLLSKVNGDTIKDAARRHMEYFLLSGLLWKFATIYNDTLIPPDDSWVWKKFPDGMEYWKAVKSLGSLKGGVQQIMNQSSPFYTPLKPQ